MTKFTVNGQAVHYLMDPATPLLWALRDASNLTGTKYGCGNGECGACIVDIDGEAVKSCMTTIAAIEGSFVTTIEGLSADRTHPAQLAFLADNVSQCGFCIPGMIMAASVLLRKNHNPGEEDIKAAISNICRCGIYPRLADAVMKAARVQRGDETIDAGALPGTSHADAARVVPALTPPHR